MAIIGIPFGGETLLASEWREWGQIERKNGSGLNYTANGQTFTINSGSRIRIGEFRIHFDATENVTLASSYSSKTTIYVYTVSDQTSKTFSELKITTNHSILGGNQEGIYNLLIATITVPSGPTELSVGMVNINNDYYEMTQVTGDSFRVSNSVSVVNLNAGIYTTSDILDLPTNGIVLVTTYGTSAKKYLLLGSDSKMYYALGNTAPLTWHRCLNENDISNYLTANEVNALLENYPTNSELNSTLSNYALNSSLSIYETKTGSADRINNSAVEKLQLNYKPDSTFAGMTFAQIIGWAREQLLSGGERLFQINGTNLTSTAFPNVQSALHDLILEIYGDNIGDTSYSFNMISFDAGSSDGGTLEVSTNNNAASYLFSFDNYNGVNFEITNSATFRKKILNVGVVNQYDAPASPSALVQELAELKQRVELLEGGN